MISLYDTSGLEIRLDETTGLIDFPESMIPVESQYRKLGQMRPFLYSSDKREDTLKCYHSYRDARVVKDTDLLKEHQIRYDITVTMPGKIGKELMKTAGHYHNYAKNTPYTYAEVYEVIHGDALFLLHKVDHPEASLSEVSIEEVLLIQAGPGEVLLIPPHYGHLTINSGNTPLVVSNLISYHSQNVYERYEEARGGPYYILDFDETPVIQANPAFRSLPDLTFHRSPKAAGLGMDGPIYTAYMKTPESFRFLTHPELLT